MAERRYNEKELAEILRAAAKSQANSSTHSEETSGFSLAEIERLAAEVGIDSSHVLAAAETLTSDSGQEQIFRFWGMPVRQTFERTIDGPMNESTWEEIVAYLREKFGYNGTPSQVGKSQEWSGGSDFRAIHISVTPKDGKLRIRIAVRLMEILAFSWLVGAVITFLISALSAGLLAKSGLEILIFPAILAILGSVWFVVHGILVRRNTIEAQMVNEVMSSMTKMIEKSNMDASLTEWLGSSIEPTFSPESVEQTTNS